MFLLELAQFSARAEHIRALEQQRAPLIRRLRSRFPGLRSFHLAPIGGGEWLDVTIWDTREDAEAAEPELVRTPEIRRWLALTGEFATRARLLVR